MKYNGHTQSLRGTYDWGALPYGMRNAFSMAGLVMAASFLGFGALIRDLGVTLSAGVFSVAAIWALPGQVVFFSMVAHGATLPATALVVTLTAIRLLPMTLLVLARVRLRNAPRWPEFLLAHLTAVTLWVIAGRSMEKWPRERRLPCLVGTGLMLMALMSVMTVIGYMLADNLPRILSAGLVFLSPAFFLTSLFANASYRFDYAAVIFGGVLSPFAVMLFPDFDLLVSGLVGGTAAFWLFAPRRGRSH